jgi:SsrA-binding protein
VSRTLIVKNRKAFHDYKILDRIEAGIVLQGTEVKAIREHRVNLKESYVKILDGEAWLEGCHISPYSHGNITNHEPTRIRKLLLNRREINKLAGAVTRSGLTVVPLSMYLRQGKVKVEIALAQGKRTVDKREKARRKTIDREVETALKRR